MAKTIMIKCIDLVLQCWFSGFEKINQIEIGEEFAYISVTIPEPPIKTTIRYLGVDLNTTGHAAVISNPHTGKVWKLGKKAIHIRKKYKQIRTKLQKQGKYQLLRQLKNRESRIIRNLNHHISKKIIQIALSNKVGIKMENLKGIRKNKKHAKSFQYSLNSWSYYQLQQFIKYKARLQGVEVVLVDPRYTSKTCSKCGTLGERNDKKFECIRCGYVDHADVNASFNIGKPVLHCITLPSVVNTKT
jgi:putative transposase